MDASDVFLQYGALGAITMCALWSVKIMFGRLTKDRDDQKERADRLEEELRKLNETVRNDYVTTISHASAAISDANRAIGDALAAVRRG